MATYVGMAGRLYRLDDTDGGLPILRPADAGRHAERQVLAWGPHSHRAPRTGAVARVLAWVRS